MPPTAAIQIPKPGTQRPARTSSRPAIRRTGAVPTDVCQSMSSITGSIVPDASPVMVATLRVKPIPEVSSTSTASVVACRAIEPCNPLVSRRKTIRISTSPVLPRIPNRNRNRAKTEARSQASGNDYCTRKVKALRMVCPSPERPRHSILYMPLPMSVSGTTKRVANDSCSPRSRSAGTWSP